MKGKQLWLFIGMALVIVFLVGVLLSHRGHETATPSDQGGGGTAAAVNYQQNINMLKEMVKTDPKNRGAWVQLGNNYYDSNQPMLAVKAYNKALALRHDDPAVLTDQGVMFRRLGWYDRAVDNFHKALKLDPTFKQSLYNMGVVYRYDLKDFAKARQAWEQLLKVDPNGSGAAQVRQELAHIPASAAASPSK